MARIMLMRAVIAAATAVTPAMRDTGAVIPLPQSLPSPTVSTPARLRPTKNTNVVLCTPQYPDSLVPSGALPSSWW